MSTRKIVFVTIQRDASVIMFISYVYTSHYIWSTWNKMCVHVATKDDLVIGYKLLLPISLLNALFILLITKHKLYDSC